MSAAAEALRRDPVFVDPAAERALTEIEADSLRAEIRSSGTPLFVAVLPGSAGDAGDVVRRLLQQTGLSGTYAAIVGDGFRATSTELADADELATAAFQAASSGGPAAVLLRFVDDVAAAPAGRSLPSGAGEGGTGQDDDGGGGRDVPSLVPIGLLAMGGVGLFAWSRRRRRREAAELRAQLAADAELIRAELAVLADDVLRLEPEVVLHPEARDDYEAAVERHRVASAALDYADEPIDLVRVERVVAEARYAMARSKALMAGREPPPPPEHLRRQGRHDKPPVALDDRGAPVYAGGQPFYGGGWFGAGSGLFGGLLLGSMLGGWGWDGPIVIDHGDGGDGGFDSGGDMGGGMGGGDWGGDIGGGDWYHAHPPCCRRPSRAPRQTDCEPGRAAGSATCVRSHFRPSTWGELGSPHRADGPQAGSPSLAGRLASTPPPALTGAGCQPRRVSGTSPSKRSP